ERNSGSLGHLESPFSGKRRFRFVVCSQSMYTRCQVQLTCLHSSNLSFALQQKWVIRAPMEEKDRRGTGGLLRSMGQEWGLLGRLLARRIERAGIVDLGDLMIGEAEHLAQDLVGVLAEQRRAGDLARAVRHLDRIADRNVLAAGG